MLDLINASRLNHPLPLMLPSDESIGPQSLLASCMVTMLEDREMAVIHGKGVGDTECELSV